VCLCVAGLANPEASPDAFVVMLNSFFMFVFVFQANALINVSSILKMRLSERDDEIPI
jgi:hypothetical protein